jgi:hypothetical protein
MIHPPTPRFKRVALALAAAILTAILATAPMAAQNPQMADKLMAIKQAQETNKAKLATYTWQETETISIKGNVKDTKVYQVQMVNGQPQKTEISNQKASSGGREGRVKEHVVEKKTEEYQQYGQQIGALAKQYTTPNPEALMQAKQAGNISIQPGGGTLSLVIKNYVKQGDSMTMTIDEQTHSPASVQVNSYLSDPKDAVTISAQFAQLPDGTNHVATTNINGVSKQLGINEQNSNYQKLQ